MGTPTLRAGALCLILSLFAVATSADTVTYVYDALGRLQEVRYPDGKAVSYALDPAGNRTQVASTVPPGVPGSITVPASSSSGNYSITWTAASGTVTAYELYQATNAVFTGQTLVSSRSTTTQRTSRAATRPSLPIAQTRSQAILGTSSRLLTTLRT